jgi:hypothetical protein
MAALMPCEQQRLRVSGFIGRQECGEQREEVERQDPEGGNGCGMRVMLR